MHNGIVFNSKNYKLQNVQQQQSDSYDCGYLYNIQLFKMVQDKSNQSRSKEQNREPQEYSLTYIVISFHKCTKATQ